MKQGIRKIGGLLACHWLGIHVVMRSTNDVFVRENCARGCGWYRVSVVRPIPADAEQKVCHRS